MAFVINLLLFPLRSFIHKDFHGVFDRMSLLHKLLFMMVHFVDKLNLWYRLPVFLGLIYLAVRRHLHQKYNLIDVGRSNGKDKEGAASGNHFVDKLNLWYRLPVFLGLIHLAVRRLLHQKYNLIDVDRSNGKDKEGAASEFPFFGRNLMPVHQHEKLQNPDPMVVATKLLARRKFLDTGKQFNMIAASWIQFMIHDWVDHLEDIDQIELRAPKEVASECPLKSFKFYKTKQTPADYNEIKTGHLNIRTPEWDGSVIYGSNAQVAKKVRTFKDGKLKIEDGLLEQDENGKIIAGDVRNTWAGLLSLQALFVQEHNLVCDVLKKEYPELKDENLYCHARLVTSAVIAKIHTIDWTVELLKMDTLLAGMRANWYGLLGKKFKDTFGHVGGGILGGLVGMKKLEDHGVPYSLTEEFTCVYRLHQLLPDTLQLRNINATPGPNKSLPLINEPIPMEDLIGGKGEESLSRIGFTKQMVSMGHQACGALELWNYPLWMRDLVAQDVDGTDRPGHIDLAALEIYRDRERSVARYNEFRRRMLQIPITKWEDLTDDEEVIETLHEVYGDDVEQLDLLVGLMAEKKIKGFAISETAFFIFLIMASRRLEAVERFTSNYNDKTYTKKGLEWVNTTESLKDVLDRHYPEMTGKWMNSNSAFSVWDSSPEPHNPIPLYFRIP